MTDTICRMAADYRRQTRTQTRHEYVLKSPATAKDIEFVQRRAVQDMPAERQAANYDDIYHVEAHDDEILIWWAEEKVDTNTW